jgi:hypothetical protein
MEKQNPITHHSSSSSNDFVVSFIWVVLDHRVPICVEYYFIAIWGV